MITLLHIIFFCPIISASLSSKTLFYPYLVTGYQMSVQSQKPSASRCSFIRQKQVTRPCLKKKLLPGGGGVSTVRGGTVWVVGGISSGGEGKPRQNYPRILQAKFTESEKSPSQCTRQVGVFKPTDISGNPYPISDVGSVTAPPFLEFGGPQNSKLYFMILIITILGKWPRLVKC